MRINFYFLPLLAVGLSMVGCSSVPYHDNLAPPLEASSFELLSPLIGQTKQKGLGLSFEYGLNRGKYVLEKENKVGSFYKCQAFCIAFGREGRYTSTSGGVWIPKDRTGVPRLYTYPNQGEHHGTSLTGVFPADSASISTNKSSSDAETIANNAAAGTIAAFSSPVVSPSQGFIGGAIAGVIVGAMFDPKDYPDTVLMFFQMEEPTIVAQLYEAVGPAR